MIPLPNTDVRIDGDLETKYDDAMTVHVEKTSLLLDAVMGDPNVKCAMVVDNKGYLIEKRGNAMCVRQQEEDDATVTMTKNGAENLYVQHLDPDFLIVVFDERMNFERVKASVDEQVERIHAAEAS